LVVLDISQVDNCKPTTYDAARNTCTKIIIRIESVYLDNSV